MVIEEELLAVQLALKAPKDQKNDFGNYKYRNCEAILEAVKQVTTKPVTLEDELVLVGDRYYVKATASFGIEVDSVTCSAYAREALNKKGMDEAQITGAASSYARKYALCGLFAIDDSSDDPDSKDNKAEPVKPVKKDLPELTDALLESKIRAMKQQKTVQGLETIRKEIKDNYTISKKHLAELGVEYQAQIEKIKENK